MIQKVNAEYVFTSEHATLTLYINYKDKTYNIAQDGQEGIVPRLNNGDTMINREYFNLALEALQFVDEKLFKLPW